MACLQVYTGPQRNLLFFVVKGDKSRVEELLKQFEWSPKELGKILWHAVRLGTVEAAYMLIEAGADVDILNQDDYYDNLVGFRTLVRNNIPGCRDFALLMVEHVADVSARSKMICILFESAIEEPSMTIDVIERLVTLYRAIMSTALRQFSSCNISPTEVTHKTGICTFFTDALFNRSDAVKVVPLLLQRNLFDDKEGSTRAANALYCCLKYAKKEQALLYAKMILDMQFSVCDLETCFTLPLAVQKEHLEIVPLLIEYGFNVNKPRKDGLLPLYIAAGLQQSTMTELLIEAGAQVNAFSIINDRKKQCAIHNACQKASAENIRVLLRHGAAIDIADNLGRTPISLLCSFHGDIMKGAHEIVIKHLAILVSKNQRIHNDDFVIIQGHHKMHTFFKLCIYELETMKTFKIINDIPFFSIFQEDITELLFATRKCDFVKNAVMCEDEFPIFYKEMVLSFNSAKKQKKLLRDKEEALYDSLKNVLPDIPMQKIICYLYFNNFDN